MICPLNRSTLIYIMYILHEVKIVSKLITLKYSKKNVIFFRQNVDYC